MCAGRISLNPITQYQLMETAMAIEPSNFRPTFGKWIYTGYSQRGWSDCYVYCIHALKRNLHLLVDAESENRLGEYFKYIEQPIYSGVEVSTSLIDDFRFLKVRLDELKFGDDGDGDSKIKEIFAVYAIALSNPCWNSWVSESKTAIDMFFRYIYYKGTKSELCGQKRYVQEQYREEIIQKIDEVIGLNRNQIQLSYDPDLLIVRDNQGVKEAVRSALDKFEIDESLSITNVSIKSDLITLTFEQD